MAKSLEKLPGQLNKIARSLGDALLLAGLTFPNLMGFNWLLPNQSTLGY